MATVISVALFGAIAGLALNGRTIDPSAVTTVSAQPNGAVASAMPLVAVAPVIHCHDVAAHLCSRIAAAAVDAIVGAAPGPARTIDVWASLLCGDTFDCPPARLVGRDPAGSAIVALAGSPAQRVNVVERGVDRPRAPVDRPLEAWLIDSGPAS
ncbi:MAG: hypothetical protein ABI553_11480 [Chloroflexota bacterium]